MSKHTPGNWYVDEHPDGLRVLTDDARSTIICQQIGPVSNDSAQADARLIAAAPMLLEALEAVMRWMPVYPASAVGIVGGRSSYAAALEKARAAIAQARGEA